MEHKEWLNLHLGNFTPWEKETNMKCPLCDCPHMDYIGETKDGFPKYKCGHCNGRTDRDPKNIEARRRVDYAIAYRDLTK